MKLVSAFGALLVVAFVASPVSAIELRVRGESRMKVDVQAAGTVAQVSGRLEDELERGIGHRNVEVRIETVPNGRTLLTRTVSTNQFGQFGVQEELPPGEYSVFVTYPRNEHFDGVQELGIVKLVPAPVQVRVFGPQIVVGRGKPAFVYGRASTADVAFQGNAQVYVGENDEPAGVVDFDASGRGSIDIVRQLAEVLRFVGRLRYPVPA